MLFPSLTGFNCMCALDFLIPLQAAWTGISVFLPGHLSLLPPLEYFIVLLQLSWKLIVYPCRSPDSLAVFSMDHFMFKKKKKKNQFTKDFVYIYISMRNSPLSFNLSTHMQSFVKYNSFSFIFSCWIAQYSISNTTDRCVRKDCGIMPRAVFINIRWHIFDLLWTYRIIVSSDLSWHIIKAALINPSLIKVRKNATAKGFVCIWQHKT